MRLISLGSGSQGNATLIESGSTRLLLDCGFAARELERRLAQVGIEPTSLDGILVTHEHTDHIRGVGPLARRHQLPVWITHGTHRVGRCGELPDLRLIHSHQSAFQVGELAIQPYPVPHDAREPVQYVLSDGDCRLGILTDAGAITPHMETVLAACDALLLEFNHDQEMLANGPYPPALQRRVGGRFGHLNNDQAIELLRSLAGPRLRHLVVAHISEKNNHPDRVRSALAEQLPELDVRITLTCQHTVSGWIEA